jgi:signal transduction histidine kinase
LVVEVVEFTRRVAQSAGVTVSTQFSDELPAVQADKVQIQQVLLNLVLNAIDAMRATERAPRDLVLAVRVLHACQLKVEVRDSGVGVAAADVERIFEAFYTTKPNGLGMGLWISRSIIRDHGGELRAQPNQRAPGATFAFTLPLVPALKSNDPDKLAQ